MDLTTILSRAEEYIRMEKHPDFRKEIEILIQKQDREEMADRFYTDLTFGTGGLRGVIGGGFNRMNPLVVRQASQGLANYITEQAGDSAGCVIAYDSRRYSDLFAQEAALVLAANGIKVYLFSSLRPTPELSFAVRRLEATAGIVITASHNPRDYNGYKVYWADGGQIIAPHDSGIIDKVRQVTHDIEDISKDDAVEKGLLVSIDEEIDTPYLRMITSQSLRPDLVAERGKDLSVVYTPLHGTGAMLIEKALSSLGINVITVPEQRDPDGDFPTVEYPNPEEASAMELALSLGQEKKADLVMGTDPDSDRLGIAVPGGNGELELINGNQLGCLLADYIFSSRRENGTLPSRPALVKTIVTTELQRKIAEAYGAEVYDVLTGFKYIADKIKSFENTDVEYVFGGEESYGYLVGTEVRDKDAVSAAVMTAEMALYYQSREETVLEHLESIYQRFGYYQEVLISRVFEGEAGLKTMQNFMSDLRKDPPRTIAGQNVVLFKDYQEGVATDLRHGKPAGTIDLPKSNVLQFLLEDESLISVRPSGTEPKIKFYASAHTEPGLDPETARSRVDEVLSGIIKEIDGMIPSSS
ncbi:MAG: phospho-sugar mutase [Spirochaetales bacterium]|nr:phospho-sugar mutase [Spirochaetales bacterium]MCF7938479.1 phospho-sugar mutase [Spirochaetales bacterium]